MQLSIGKLATTIIVLSIAVTAITTGIGLSMLHGDYRTLQNEHETEAQDTVRNAALSIRNQIRFYQGILQLVSTNPDVGNLLVFGEVSDITSWSEGLRRLLPGTLGTALASTEGHVYGDPTAQRVGPTCVLDMKRLHEGIPIEFPPLHTDVPGLEHFDLLTQVKGPDGKNQGTVFVSFKLSIIEELLHMVGLPGDRFELRDGRDVARLTIGSQRVAEDSRSYAFDVPDTSWKLVLVRQLPPTATSLRGLIGVDAILLSVMALLLIILVRTTTSGIKRDITRLRAALSDVLNGEFQYNDAPTAIRETQTLFPDIEKLAQRLQDQHNELRERSLSDPLTGVFNRRYFDMMLAHLHEQSRRQQAAYLAIFDLDDFQRINDSYGHEVGDHVLQSVARFLHARVRATDIVARLGGDAFALVLTHMAVDVLEDWLKRLLADYDQRGLGHQAGKDIHCRLSVGVAAIDAQRYPSADSAFAAADRALHAVQQQANPHGSRFAFDHETVPQPVRVLPLDQH